MRSAALVLVLCTGSTGLFGQQPAFEVASIKPAAIESDGYFAGRTAAGPCGKSAVKISGNSVRISMISLCGLIRVAYGVQEFRIADVPKALMRIDRSNYYDIDARAAGEGVLSNDRALLMLQSLLEERFQLKFHRETRELPVYALVVGKNGPKLSEDGKGVCGEGGALDAAMTGRYGRGVSGFVICKPSISAAQLADMLTPETDRPVLDKTGLTDKYAFQLHFSREEMEPGPGSAPTLPLALQEQLGLKLEPRKAPVEVLVIDRAERPAEN